MTTPTEIERLQQKIEVLEERLEMVSVERDYFEKENTLLLDLLNGLGINLESNAHSIGRVSVGAILEIEKALAGVQL